MISLATEARIRKDLAEHPDRCTTSPKHVREDGNVLVERNHLMVGLHRRLYELEIGPLRGRILQQCPRTFGCFNPHHRLAVKRKGLRQKVPTCPKGHPYTPENEMPAGERLRCKACYEERVGKPWQPAAPQPTCKRGHEFTPENTYIWVDKKGLRHRICRECRRARAASEEPQRTEK